MKEIRYIIVSALAAIILASSCTKEINLGNTVDESRYLSAVYPKVCILDDNGKAFFNTVEMHDWSTTIKLTAALKTPARKKVDVNFVLGDDSVIEKYNREHGTSYNVFPSGNVSLTFDETCFMKGDDTAMDKLRIDIKLDNVNFKDFETYAIPVIAKTSTEGFVSSDPFIVFVKDYRNRPDNTKYVTGTNRTMTIFSCTETGNANILDNLSFKLKNSGKYLIDCVLLFSNGMDYNTGTGELEISAKTGPDAQAGRPETIIEAMHAHGLKVILSVTSYGVSQLDKTAAKEYARTVANYCRAFNLDGVFYDDEYTNLDKSRKGFISSSATNSARLCYETKMAMPDKMVVTYLYGTIRGATDIAAVDGVPMSDIVDFALNDYGGTVVPKCLPASKVAYKSDNFAESYKNVNTNSASTCTQIKNGGYGAHFFYLLSPGRWEESNAMSKYVRPSLTNIASIWFGDEIVCEDYDAKVDW